VIRVLIADDHGVVRDGLGRLVEALPDMELVGLASDGEEAVERARDAEPDVVLMDLDMPRVDGIEATRRLLADRPKIAVLVLTSFSDRPRIMGALEAGASGYLLKDADPDEVAAAIRSADRGEVHLDPTVAGRLTRRLVSPPTGLAALTARERSILALVARGMSNHQIAAELYISERTARTHVSHILAKLQLTSRTQAALVAIREGLVTPPSS
jgi:DNA-binding NarL/FixJ family response regulator